jgi:hypothetical protein
MNDAIELLNALKALFELNTTTSAEQAGARIPILNSANEVIGSQSIATLADIFANAGNSDEVIAKAFAYLFAEVLGLKAQLANLGEAKATTIDASQGFKVCGGDIVVVGSGAPSVVPKFIGQFYVDVTNKKLYFAYQLTNSANDWTLV